MLRMHCQPQHDLDGPSIADMIVCSASDIQDSASTQCLPPIMYESYGRMIDPCGHDCDSEGAGAQSLVK